MVTPDLQVLELNADFIPLHLVPLSTVGWKKAFKKIYEEVAVPVSYYENEWVQTPHERIRVPSVIIMKDYKHFNKHAKWSKFNVKLRDDFLCQYCGKRFSARALTIDHVHAKSKGGKFTWENSATACKPCNNKKKDHHAMKPMRTPYRPDYFELAKKMVKYHSLTDESWNQYLAFLTKRK